METCIETVKKEKERIEKFKSNNVEWCKYNNQYKSLVARRILALSNEITNISSSYYTFDSNQTVQMFLESIKHINDVYDDDLMSIYDIFRFEGYNYIIFGKNGAGKTSLLKKLSKELNINNFIVAPATRQIGYNNDFFFGSDDINLAKALSNDSKDKTMFLLSMCVMDRELDERRRQFLEKNIITNKIKDIFESLGLDRSLGISSNGDLNLYSEPGKEYSLSMGSDGERAILYFIMLVLLSPSNSFLFIDEPETHLNGALMKKIFNCLESERKDIKFIYATHNIPFIESRKIYNWFI